MLKHAIVQGSAKWKQQVETAPWDAAASHNNSNFPNTRTQKSVPVN